MKLRTGDPWMSAEEYGHSLSGLSINLLVKDMGRALRFQTRVIGASVVYCDPDFAAVQGFGSEWMLHADHTYDGNPMYGFVAGVDARGIGIELRLHGCDPDQAAARARADGFIVIADAEDKPHGLRESYIADDDGYIWVPDVPVLTF